MQTYLEKDIAQIDVVQDLMRFENNDEFTKNMEKFCSKYSSNVSTDSDDGVKGTVIYSGDTVPSYKDYAYINFHQIAEQFVPKGILKSNRLP